MLNLVKVLLFFLIFVVCFALALAAVYVYTTVTKTSITELADSAMEKARIPKATPSLENNELASIIESYRQAERESVAGGGDGAGGAVVKHNVKPIPTPGPDNKVITEWPSGRKWVALTFDDGPHPTFTPRFIELLQTHNAKGTFFLLGPNAEKQAGLTKQIVDCGFEVANHTWAHKTLSSLKPEKVREELAKTNAAIKAASGADAVLLRPPYGTTNKKVQDVCQEVGLTIVNWSIDTNDWRSNWSEEKIVKEITDNLRDGAIILFHDRSEKTYAATEAALLKGKELGYEFVTVSELLGLKPYSPPQAAATQDSTSATVTAATVQETATLPRPIAVSESARDGLAEPALPAPSMPAVSPRAVQGLIQTGLPDVDPGKITTIPSSSRR